MPKQKSKSAARQDRRSERARHQSHRGLIASISDEDSHQHAPVRFNGVTPLNNAQRAYDAAIVSGDIVFGLGPAGTGKTWYAVAKAVEAYLAGNIKKIYLTRPNVEVERSFGFLPGELEEKYEPYIAPLREAFVEMLGASRFEYMLKKKIIDPRPLAFMRGATFKDAWLIADEMQNATLNEMKMLLSRIGENAKFIINGDPAQCDIVKSQSGLIPAERKLAKLSAVRTIRFTKADIVRSGLCQQIIEAFEEPEAEEEDAGLKRYLAA